MNSGRGMQKCEPMSRPILPPRAPRDPSMQDRQVANQAAQLEAQAKQEVKAEKAEENKEATESGNAPSSIEKSGESNTNSESDNDSGQDTPFAQRLANRFNPSSITSGNLIDIIS